jgi:hypothetical protein
MGAERGGIEAGQNGAWLLPSTLRQWIRVTGVAHVEAGRSRWHGAAWQLARSELTAARSALQRSGACAQGRNGRWAGCPVGLGSVL